MARIVSVFQFTGRVGTAVGLKGKGGKINLRQYQPSVANPRTEAQLDQRAKIKLASQVAAMLGEVGRISLIANGHRKTERGQLVKNLLKNIVVTNGGSQAFLQYDLNLVDNPTYTEEEISLVVTNEANAYVATYSGASEGEAIAKCIMVHNLNTGSWRHTAVLNTNNTISLAKSVSDEGNDLEIFAYGIVLMPKTSDAYNSLSQTGANTAGFVLDLNKVSTSSFNFSPTLSASLNVPGNQNENQNQGGNGSNGSNGNGDSSQNQNSQNNQNTQTDTVAAPTISGNTSFTDTTEVTITGPAEAEIRYTTNGTTPTAESTLYSAALTLSDTTTVKAIAIKNGVSSEVSTQTFTKGSNGDNGDTN